MLTRTLKRRAATQRSRVDGVGGGIDRTAPGSKDIVPGRRSVAACNGAMGSPKHGRALEASRPALRACNRQFYGEGRVLGSRAGLPRFNSGRSPRTPHGTRRGLDLYLKRRATLPAVK